MALPLQFYNPRASQTLLMAQQIRAYEHLPPAEQQVLQRIQLHRLLSHAQKYSFFWQQRLEQARFGPDTDALEIFEQLPILSRADLQNSFESLRAYWPTLKKEDVQTSTTSGSTGVPVRVEKAASIYAPLYAATMWAETQWHQRDPRRKIAVLTMRAKDTVMSSSWGHMYESLGLYGACIQRNLKDHSTASHLEWLKTHQPDYLKTSPFTAADLAQLAIEQGVHLPIKQILSQAERVTPRQRALCQQAFGAKIIDRYSCEETGWIALQCPNHDHLHVLNATTLVEIVDENGKPCPPGTVGRVLITSLHSFAMPIIRYEVGDLAEWGPPCDCGITLPVIARLWGRTRHSVQLPSGEAVPMRFLGDDIGKMNNVRAFRVAQYKTGDIEIQIEAKNPLTELEVQSIRDLFYNKVSTDLPLHIKQVDHIDWGLSYKREEFIRLDVPWSSNLN